jgi:hypothetical protein
MNSAQWTSNGIQGGHAVQDPGDRNVKRPYTIHEMSYNLQLYNYFKKYVMFWKIEVTDKINSFWQINLSVQRS